MSPNPTNISPPPLKRRRVSPSTPRQVPAPPSSLPARIPPSQPATAQTSLSIYSWNINGITPFLRPSTPKITGFFTPTSPPSKVSKPTPPAQPSLRACLRRWKWPHILCLQEVKIKSTDTKTQASIRRAINVALDSDDEDENISKRHNYDAYFVLPRDKYNATGFRGKVYGVCTLVRRNVVDTRPLDVEWDLEGRVLLVEIPSIGIVVFNVYAVNGTTNDYRDPKTGKVVGDRHDRKREFHTLLAKEVKKYEQLGWGVVVAGDINVSRMKIDSFPQLRMGEEHVKNRADFEGKIIKGAGMIDTFRLKMYEGRKYSYRPRDKPWGAGGDRVDMILVSKGLKESVKEADILDSEEERGPSDHVPLFVELEIAQMDKTDVEDENGGEIPL